MLLKRGIDLAVLTSSNQKAEPELERVYTLPVLISNYPLYIATPYIHQIKKVILLEQPDVVHIQSLSLVSLAVIWIVKRLGIPVVIGMHDLPRNIAVYSPIAYNLIDRIAKRLLLYFFNKASVAIAPSYYAKSYYRHLGVHSMIRVVSNGVDPSFFYPSYQSTQIFKKQYLSKIDLTLPRVIFVGRVMPDKDLEVMIEAIRDLDVVPIIVGYAWPKYLRTLKTLACEKGVFTGFIPFSILPGAYNSCDIFIQPSTTELQSLSVLEAMASGLPVVGVNSGPIPELVSEGINGYLFEPYKYDELRRRIECILENEELRKNMKAASRTIAKRHLLTDTVDEYIKIYTEYSK
jgi:glycosyltransferase involved in cell wall biosynthesis